MAGGGTTGVYRSGGVQLSRRVGGRREEVGKGEGMARHGMQVRRGQHRSKGAGQGVKAVRGGGG